MFRERCIACNGTGLTKRLDTSEWETQLRTCIVCGGSGRVVKLWVQRLRRVWRMLRAVVGAR
jgi:DnaJ-class molecular chaperone